MQDSSFDDPHFIATMVDNWLTPGYKSAANSYLNVPKVDPSTAGAGLTMFRTRCAACHTVGGGDFVGPDLLGVTTVRDRQWLAKFMLAPDKMLEDKDRVALAICQIQQSENAKPAHALAGRKDNRDLLKHKPLPPHRRTLLEWLAQPKRNPLPRQPVRDRAADRLSA